MSEELLRRLSQAASLLGEKADDVSSPWERERLSDAAQACRDALSSLHRADEPVAGWSVTVEKNGRDILTLSDNCQAGDSRLDARLVRKAAEHLLAFIGDAAEPKRDGGWLVERHEGGRIFYLRIDNLDQGYAWHEDSLKATRFARRQDAEHAAEGGELQDLRIAEHMWVPR